MANQDQYIQQPTDKQSPPSRDDSRPPCHQCESSNGGACIYELAARLDDELCSVGQQLNTVRKVLSAYPHTLSRLGQSRIDSLNAEWWNFHGAQQKIACETIEGLQKRLEAQMAENQAAQATLKLQNREVLRARGVHSQIEDLERQLAESKSVKQAADEALEMQKQRIAELEAGLEEHESLKLQFSALEAQHAEAIDLLMKAEQGSITGELIGQNRALEQQLRELRAENQLLAERLEGKDGGKGEGKHDMHPDSEREGKARITGGAGDEGKGRKRRRAK